MAKLGSIRSNQEQGFLVYENSINCILVLAQNLIIKTFGIKVMQVPLLSNLKILVSKKYHFLQFSTHALKQS